MRTHNRVGVIHAYPSAWLIDALHGAGWQVVLIGDFSSMLGDTLGCQAVISCPLWDESELIQRVQAFHRQTPFDVLLPVYEGATVLTARLSQRLGLHCYCPAAAISSRHKLIANQLWALQGIPVPRTLPLLDLSHAWFVIESQFGGDAVLKLSDSMNSQGVIRVRNAQQCADACRQFEMMLKRTRSVAYATDRNRGAYGQGEIQILVQEYCSGPEFGVDVIFEQGNGHVLGVFEKAESSGPCFAETMSAWPTSHSPQIEQKIGELALQAALALGAHVGCAHVEMRLTSDGLRVIEAGLRPGGAYTVRAAELLTGVCQYRWLASALMGEELPVPHTATGAVLYGGVAYPHSGVLTRVQGIDVFDDMECLVDFQILNRIGDTVYALPSSAQPHYCYYLLNGQSREQLLGLHERIQHQVQLHIQDEVRV